MGIEIRWEGLKNSKKSKSRLKSSFKFIQKKNKVLESPRFLAFIDLFDLFDLFDFIILYTYNNKK